MQHLSDGVCSYCCMHTAEPEAMAICYYVVTLWTVFFVDRPTVQTHSGWPSFQPLQLMATCLYLPGECCMAILPNIVGLPQHAPYANTVAMPKITALQTLYC